MCFSAQMSFLAVGLLLSIAAATYHTLRTSKQILLAGMPLLFAMQQAAEGVLWLLLPRGQYPLIISIAKYTYLTFAFLIWPLYVPMTVLMLEKTELRRALISICFVIGLGWSLASLWYFTQYGADVSIASCHIDYRLRGLSDNYRLQIGLYSLTTILPFFLSSHRLLQMVGVLMGLSCILSLLIWHYYFISVWCFFAALISLAAYFVVRKNNQDS